MQQEGHGILYTRYTMTSAHKSIIPELTEKLELDNVEQEYKILKTSIEHNNGSFMQFSGIKTSSGNQTASLKSIQGISTFVIDEGEEWLNEDEFDKIRYSIRAEGVQHRTIFIMNPSNEEHFIYKRYIKNNHKVVTVDGVDLQISTHPDVEHIHTTYLDNIKYVPKYRLNEIYALRDSVDKNDLEKYAHIWLGRWGIDLGGMMYNSIQQYNPNELDFTNAYNFSFTDVADGGGDYLCTFIISVLDSKLFVRDAIYSKQSSMTTIPLMEGIFREYNTINNIIETNNQGSVFISNFQRNGFAVTGVRATGHKLTRIQSLSFLTQKMYFNPSGSEMYNQAFRDIQYFPLDGKVKNDDAPDCIAMATKWFNVNGYI
jgi:PBSX family phage terminase large subunit